MHQILLYYECGRSLISLNSQYRLILHLNLFGTIFSDVILPFIAQYQDKDQLAEWDDY